MFNSILVICTGNICRSPIAERILRNLLPSIKVDSAGTGAMVGHSADETAALIAAKHNISLDNHEGRQLTSAMARNYDLLLVMEHYHVQQINQIAPEVRGKTMLLGHWLGGKEIPDPYRKNEEAFELVYKLVEQSCSGWANKLG
ncbi:TPA: protein tyrosine phosphatase [Klebsiella pneumoniae]